MLHEDVLVVALVEGRRPGEERLGYLLHGLPPHGGSVGEVDGQAGGENHVGDRGAVRRDDPVAEGEVATFKSAFPINLKPGIQFSGSRPD